MLTSEDLFGFLPKRLPAVYRKRINQEINAFRADSRFEENGTVFLHRFSVLLEIKRWAYANGIPTDFSSGQVNASLMAYYLGLTGIDPIEHGLPFEAYFNEKAPEIPFQSIQAAPRDVPTLRKYFNSIYGQGQADLIPAYSQIYFVGDSDSEKLHQVEKAAGTVSPDFYAGSPDLETLFEESRQDGLPIGFSSDLWDLLRRFHASSFSDVNIITSLYRPGLMDLIPSLIENRNLGHFPKTGNEAVDEYLKETCGLVIWEEQATCIISMCTGLPLADSDILRWQMKKPNEATRQYFLSLAPDCPKVYDLLISNRHYKKAYNCGFTAKLLRSAYLFRNHHDECMKYS